jgi:hypothetical protein
MERKKDQRAVPPNCNFSATCGVESQYLETRRDVAGSCRSDRISLHPPNIVITAQRVSELIVVH